MIRHLSLLFLFLTFLQTPTLAQAQDQVADDVPLMGHSIKKTVPTNHADRWFFVRPFFHLSSYFVNHNNSASEGEIFQKFLKNIPQAGAYETKILNDLLSWKLSDDEWEEILRGGKVFLKKDQGSYHQSWKKMEGLDVETKVGTRKSSHPSLNRQRHHYGPLFGEILFGKDLHEGEPCTWFQLEAHRAGLNHPFEFILHSVDYILGKVMLGWNIGPYGASGYIDNTEMIIDPYKTSSSLTDPKEGPFVTKVLQKVTEKKEKELEKGSGDKKSLSIPFYRFYPLFSFPE